jgi:hypothetical protein
VVACAEPVEDDTFGWALLVDEVLFELLELVPELLLEVPEVLVESSLVESSLVDSSLLELPVFATVDELSLLEALELDRDASVASRAARPKPAVAATAATARPAVTADARRLPCSRDVMAPPLKGST